MRVALVGADQNWMADYCRRIMTLNFAQDRAIDSPSIVAEVLAQLNLPAQHILTEAQSESNKLKLREQTRVAAEKGIFGAPTFIVGNAMFWGNDRLDDALEECAKLATSSH